MATATDKPQWTVERQADPIPKPKSILHKLRIAESNDGSGMYLNLIRDDVWDHFFLSGDSIMDLSDSRHQTPMEQVRVAMLPKLAENLRIALAAVEAMLESQTSEQQSCTNA